MLLDSYIPILEGALPCEESRDPLALTCPLDTLGLLCGADSEQEPGEPSVDIVVCVHDALEHLRTCLSSLLAKSERRFRLILVNDGSGAATTRFLRAFADRHPAATLIERERPPHGYTLAANRGLELSSGDYAVLLNSDTIPSAGWLRRLLAHGEAQESVGILGPLSNAASHQSVPVLRDGGGWATNALPDWLTVDGMGLIVERGVPHAPAHLPFLNGFCYAIKRSVLEAVGEFDGELFPAGYCEENDYSQRAREAGFELAVATDAYVHHAKSRSYGPGARAELAKRNYETFLDKHGRARMQALVSAMEADRSLEPVRAAVAERSASPRTIAPLLADGDRGALRIVFLLPGLAHGGSGGAHSIYQEVKGLRSLGVHARIALPRWDRERAAGVYEDAEEIVQTFADGDDLLAKTADADVISATHHKSVALLEAIHAARSDFLPAYYVQDYEPFFTAPYIAEEAIASYTALPGMLLFAKSDWLCNVVAERHGLLVEKVEASLDRRLFAPAQERVEGATLRVLAMVRPRTARRQPLATLAVLERLLERFPGRVHVRTFGCYADELREILPDAEEVLERHLGILTRAQVAERMRQSDVFLDMSVYQAFGRTALEAMACGATAVVPAVGGAWEFVEEGRNALAVDTFDSCGALEALSGLVGDRELLERLKEGARESAMRYSIERAALSEYLAFERAHRERFGTRTTGVAAGDAVLARS
jgi:GT2 family glycosyltransferase/glycosyltransferase involved in cell wall biosynthesis